MRILAIFQSDVTLTLEIVERILRFNLSNRLIVVFQAIPPPGPLGANFIPCQGKTL
jgi:hypothetical protein